MAKEASEERRDEEEQSGKGRDSRRWTIGFVVSVLLKRWLAVLLGISVLGHGIGYAYHRMSLSPVAGDDSPEVSLGSFQFEWDSAPSDEVIGVEFNLHVALLSQIDQMARRELHARKFRVQQAVEELIRRTHGGDFDDPLLTGLKNRLQERINETLGIRVIADIIITDLKLERTSEETEGITQAADSMPWVEETPEELVAAEE